MAVEGSLNPRFRYRMDNQGSILDLKFEGEAIRFKAEIGQYTRGRGVCPLPCDAKVEAFLKLKGA